MVKASKTALSGGLSVFFGLRGGEARKSDNISIDKNNQICAFN
jgi:hypothetical protein